MSGVAARNRFIVTPRVQRKPGFRTKVGSKLYVYDMHARKFVAGPFEDRDSATIARDSIRVQVREIQMTKRSEETVEETTEKTTKTVEEQPDPADSTEGSSANDPLRGGATAADEKD